MTNTFTLVRNQIIFKACRMSGVLEQGQDPEPELLATAAEYLNLVVKELEVHRKKLWAVERAEIVVQPSSRVQHNGIGYYCLQTHTSDEYTEPGIGLDWRDFWRSDANAPESGLPAWATATLYLRGGQLPTASGATSIEGAMVRQSDVDYPLTIINRFQDIRIPDKGETGRPHSLRFNRPDQTITFFPIPDEEFTITYEYIRLLEDALTAGGQLDIPQTLIGFMIFELAAWLAEEYGQQSEKIMRLRSTAQVKLALAIRNQTEYQSNSIIAPIF